MFSYRHAFHAGNHADVLKHLTLIAVLRHLTQKDTPLQVFDTHAGAGLYRLDGDLAQTSGEAAAGVLRLVKTVHTGDSTKNWLPARENSGFDAPLLEAKAPFAGLAPAVQDYLDVVAAFNPGGSMRVYPGSPMIAHHLLHGRARDRIKLFELHPTDGKTLQAHVDQLQAGRMVAVAREDGFAALPRFLPPPSRRALVVCDPSYELKSDYARVAELMAQCLQRFATGCCLIWYPVIPRPEAHDLPRKLKILAQRHHRPWLNASLTVKSSKITVLPTGETVRPGLPASGVFVVNPPHTLEKTLKEALQQITPWLAQADNASYQVSTGAS